MSAPSQGPLMSVRTALVFLTAVVVGILAAMLSYLSSRDLAAAALVGCGSLGGALVLCHALIGR